ncbi:FRG domain-containing protein [Rhodovulum sulfidophilum]|uniref:FRG domain-containing protein n=1 Tax=Rhodovulum sulfidophilum TaxID=35806 RepID=A0ABS1RYT3_RHOSU|nr:FRG domain-containing protein [Rhodovulum sulfidophilum]MBL3611052.1 FRG domain-containing protein [Rhodovulum sulfidophilum]MCE8455386.1 FRG domain-containing protein [Rhodovulum sulfidophilum]
MTGSISSIGELIEAIRTEKGREEGTIWFRGQSDSSWKLLPGLLRQKNRMSETSLLARFKQSAALLALTKPGNSFDWVFLMQHYGMPTRLLDWSENPLVAMYFAVTGGDPDTDAAVWMLRPNKLNTNAHISDKDEPDYIPSFDDEEVQGYSTERVRIDKRMQLFPIATIATRNNARIQAQLGTFTIHHNEPVPIEEVGSGDQCVRLIIPSAAKQKIREELSLLGINQLSLFPEIASISETLKEVM